MTKFDFALISGDRRTVASTWLPAGSAVPALQTLQTQAAEETDRPARLTIDGSEYFALQVPLTDMHGVVVAQVLITRSSADFRAVLKEFKLDFGALALGFLLSRMLTGKLNQEMAQRVEAEERSQNSLARLTRQGGQIVFVQDLARIANEARNFHQAIDATLDRICEFSGWHLAHAYLPEGDDLSVMQPSGFWVVKGPDREQFLPFMERTGQGRLRAGEGLFDSILENGQTVLIADVGQCQEFSRRAAAAACGLHGGFALGIKAGGQVVGILEFYSTHVGLPPEDLQASLSDIGVQLGRVAEREIILDRLELAASEAVSANQAKSVFLANMSPELRTPLNAIIGFSELIKSEVFGPVGAPQYTDYINDIHESGGHLLSVINDVLDMSKIEAGQLEPLFIDVDMAGIAETCMSFSSGRASNGEVNLESRIGNDLPAVFADERMMKQMILNLLSNAIKFTPPQGTVILSVWADNEQGCVVEVRDDGIGMDPNNLEMVMRPFGQVDDNLNRTSEGTGLGLPLVKSMAEMHDGTLEIETALGRGTTVTITLPPDRIVENVRDLLQSNLLRR